MLGSISQFIYVYEYVMNISTYLVSLGGLPFIRENMVFVLLGFAYLTENKLSVLSISDFFLSSAYQNLLEVWFGG